MRLVGGHFCHLYKRWSELNAELEPCGGHSGESCSDPCGLLVNCTIVGLRNSGGTLAEFRTDFTQQFRYVVIALISGPKHEYSPSFG